MTILGLGNLNSLPSTPGGGPRPSTQSTRLHKARKALRLRSILASGPQDLYSLVHPLLLPQGSEKCQLQVIISNPTFSWLLLYGYHFYLWCWCFGFVCLVSLLQCITASVHLIYHHVWCLQYVSWWPRSPRPDSLVCHFIVSETYSEIMIQLSILLDI